MKTNKTLGLILCAFFAVFTAVCSQIALPLGEVPFNLATFSVLCAGSLLGAKRGALSQLIYLLLGAAGAPVFALFRSGVGVIIGLTGGYLAGYAAAAFFTGLISERSGGKAYLLFIAMLSGFFTYMVLGTLWYMFSTETPLYASLLVCVVPLLPADALKMLAALILTKRLRTALGEKLNGRFTH